MLSPIESIIADARAGNMFILVDGEDRENEGDLVLPAEKADAAAINFMAKHGRGLICLALTGERVKRLGLKLMAQANASRHQTAFTVSIEAREGVTTGISAADRACTIAAAIDPAKGAPDIVSPGHVFPLVAREGGVLVRAGHTEAAVDIARLARLNPSGVICEIMNDDGTMARLPDLKKFAQEHGLKIAAIADLIAYRRRHDKLVRRELTSEFESLHGGAFALHVYVNTVEYAEHIALVKGDVGGDAPVLVRMHALDLLSDALGDAASGRAEDLRRSMEIIGKEGRGVVVLLREPRRDVLSARLRLSQTFSPRRKGKGEGVKMEDGHQPSTMNHQPGAIRDYGIGAQILLDLGVRAMTLLSNSGRSVIALEGYGLSIAGYRKIG